MVKKKIIINILLAIFWTVLGTGTIVLLAAAIRIKDSKKCSGVEITIKAMTNNFFVDKDDILKIITAKLNGEVNDNKVSSFDLKNIEIELEKNIWIKKAQLFFDNNEKLQVNVTEREPVARVFSSYGTTFYVDEEVSMLPLSDKFSARLPVFTNFPSDKKVLLPSDSSLLRDIILISQAIQKDSFYMAMIEQIDITPQNTFEMLPKLGNAVIVVGDAKNIEKKLANLRLFYKEIIVKAGWSRYSEINIQYNNQVVAKRKGVEDVIADSLRTLQLIQLIADNAKRLSEDSLQTIIQDNEKNSSNSNMIQQSMERDENSDSTQVLEPVSSEANVDNKKSAVVVKQNLDKQKKTNQQLPKAVSKKNLL
jgi:cell division protein FtsQ